MTKISSIVQSVHNLWPKLLKCISNALYDTTTHRKAHHRVHNMYISVSTSFGVFGKRFAEDTVTFTWYASLFPCYLHHYFTQQLEKIEWSHKMFWIAKKMTNLMIYRWPFYPRTVEKCISSALHTRQRKIKHIIAFSTCILVYVSLLVTSTREI